MHRGIISLRSEILYFGIRQIYLSQKIKYLSGPELADLQKNKLKIISVVRNGENYIDKFIQHYEKIGDVEFVFLLNDSTDGSYHCLSKYKNITILRCNLPYNKFENTFKRYLLNKYAGNQWALLADIDEFFDFPLSSSVSLEDFLGYLDTCKFNAVVTQMLDLFPQGNLLDQSEENFIESHKFYDIDNIEKRPYYPIAKGNYHPDATIREEITYHFGGIRKSVFGTNNGLTKISLIKNERFLKSFTTAHHTRNAKIADISCVLKHYPFTSEFSDKVNDAVKTDRYGHTTTPEYVAYANKINASSYVILFGANSQQFHNCDQLLESNFLYISENYRNWCDYSTQIKHN